MVARKYEDRYLPGTLDTFLAHRSRSAWCELKLIKAWPIRDTTALRIAWSPEQIRTGQEFVDAGLRVVGLTGIAATQQWFLHDFAALKMHDFAMVKSGMFAAAVRTGSWRRSEPQEEQPIMIMQWLGSL